MKPKRLVTIIREDLSPGYQIAQTSHAVANFCLAYRDTAIRWHVEGNYIIALSVPNLSDLKYMYKMLESIGVDITMFYEPDISEHTAIAFVANQFTDSETQYLNLAGRFGGDITKHTVERGDSPQEVLQ